MSSSHQGQNITLKFHDLASAYLLFSPCPHYIVFIHFDFFSPFPIQTPFLIMISNAKTLMSSPKASLNDPAEDHGFKVLFLFSM